MRVWERGAGETLACGTGACATAYAAFRNGLCGRKVTVHLLGGDLEIEITDDTILMTGPRTTVFARGSGSVTPTCSCLRYKEGIVL